ncbi:MAG TPA: two-component regulator propeller domain-containing protein, partial [Pyrinomonadaceae bacterium]|nr:two-component regulator propeller domain-containing protein [Pyrinomonadaceae bacterium]
MPSLKRLFVFLIFLLLNCPQIFGQYRFDFWTTDNGLPQNGVRAISQTPDGYIWFTTFDGLVRFDGVKFTIFNKSNTKGIINNRFNGLYCDKDGTLYAISAEGGTLTTYKSGVFNSFTAEEVPERYIESVAPYKDELGVLVVGGENYDRSWYFLRDRKFVYSETLDKITHKFEQQGTNGTRWILSKENITELREGNATVYDDRLDKLQYTRPYLSDSKGGLWLGGFKLAHLQDGKIENFPADQYGFSKTGNFHQFWEENDGSFWFAQGGPSGEGVGLVRYQDGKFSTFGKEFGLSDSNIFCVFKDREGVIWLATNKGINRLRKQIIKTYNDKDGLNSSEVYPMLRDSKDNIWIGTTKGLTIYRNGKFEPVKLHQTDKNLPEYLKWKDDSMAIQSLWEDRNGKIWIGVGGALYTAENGNIKLIHGGQHIYAIRQDKAGNVWAATNKGILLFQDYQLKTFYSVAEGLPNEMMTTIYEDSHGRLWFGGFGGLSEFKEGKFINYTAKEGLTGNHVRSIYEDADGILWIGTYGEGLSRFKDGKFVNYTIENGLFTNDVFAIQEDSHNNFWISSNRGIYHVNRQELNDFADGKIEKIHSSSYGKEDGMLNNECNGGRQPATLKDKNGKFWFPTQDGVAIVDSEFETSNPLPPSVVIESATVEKQPIEITNGLTVEPGQRNIEINFTGISSIKPEQIKFKYKLEGHDPDWVDAGTRRTAYYSSLPPGNYQFLVKAANSDGVWNE